MSAESWPSPTGGLVPPAVVSRAYSIGSRTPADSIGPDGVAS
jgi:hypothetical protein